MLTKPKIYPVSCIFLGSCALCMVTAKNVTSNQQKIGIVASKPFSSEVSYNINMTIRSRQIFLKFTQVINILRWHREHSQVLVHRTDKEKHHQYQAPKMGPYQIVVTR